MTRCPVAELERQLLAAMAVADAAEERLRATPEKDRPRYREDGTRRSQGDLGRTARGAAGRPRSIRARIFLQLVQRYRAIDAGDSAEADRLDAIIREGVEFVRLAIGAQLTAPEQTAAK